MFPLPDRPTWTLMSRAGWDKGRLVIVSYHETPGTFFLEKLALDAQGLLEIEFTGPNLSSAIPITDTARYRKVLAER